MDYNRQNPGAQFQVSAQQGQLFMQSDSGTQQFRPWGQGMPPGQTQAQHFFQPLQQMPARPGLPGNPAPSSQAIPIPYIQPSMTFTYNSPQFQNSATTNNLVPGIGGSGVPPSFSYTFSTPSFGQPHNAMTVSSQFQPVSQMQAFVAPMGGQHWLPCGSQGAPAVTMPQTGQQSAAPADQQAMSVPNIIQEASSDWQEYTSGDGRRYFYNKSTKQSSWEKPFELMTPLERADASTAWKEVTTAEGRKYYYNKDTKQSKWTIPEELKLAREQAEMVINPNAPATVKSHAPEQPSALASSANDSLAIPRVASSPGAVTPLIPSDSAPTNLGPRSSSTISGVIATSSPVAARVDDAPTVSGNTSSSPRTNLENSSSLGVANTLDGASLQDIKHEAKKGMAVAGKVNVTQLEEKIMDGEALLYASKQEAKDAFNSLLESANVEADWNWEQAMRVIINDKRYGALKTLGERKQAFNKYLMQRKKLDAEERLLRQRKAIDEFTKMLEESKELMSSMRWSKAMEIFEDDERYKAVERPADREDLFKNYMADLKKKERAKAQEEQHQNKLKYRHFLETCGFIKVDTQWRKVQDRLEDDDRCSRLAKIDRVEIFQEYIRDLEKEEDEQRKLKKEQIKKVERRNRDEFRKMMEEHVVSGILTANTRWRDYFEKVKESVAYQAVASNTSGPTPKDLFEDVAEELENKYHDDKARVKESMKLKKVTVVPAWTFEDFKAAIQDGISPSLFDINLQLVFEDLLERAKEKEKKESRKRQRFAKAFAELLYNIKEITASSTWEDCKQLFEESSEYRSIGDESFARVTFEEHVSSLLEKEHKREEEKAKKDKEEKEKTKEKERDREREKDKGKERSKDESDSESVDVTGSYGHQEEKKSNKDKERKHRRKRHRGVNDEKKHHRHSHDSKKPRKHARSPESNSESRHTRHKRDRRNDPEELEEGELGEDGEIH